MVGGGGGGGWQPTRGSPSASPKSVSGRLSVVNCKYLSVFASTLSFTSSQQHANRELSWVLSSSWDESNTYVILMMWLKFTN